MLENSRSWVSSNTLMASASSTTGSFWRKAASAFSRVAIFTPLPGPTRHADTLGSSIISRNVPVSLTGRTIAPGKLTRYMTADSVGTAIETMPAPTRIAL